MTTQATFTPGPWRRAKLVIHTRGFVIANVLHELEPQSVGNSLEVTANADLIAAAPELYEALRKMLRYSETTDDTSSRCVEVEDVARAVLAKAEARAP
jgi:hypothetical protein